MKIYEGVSSALSASADAPTIKNMTVIRYINVSLNFFMIFPHLSFYAHQPPEHGAGGLSITMLHESGNILFSAGIFARARCVKVLRE